MSRAEQAKAYFLQGYNCSQAVALAFADMTELSTETLAKIMQPFGGGLGRMRLTCGAVSGMCAMIGILFGKADPTAKKDTYAIVQELCGKFKAENGSLICAELLTGSHVKAEIGGEAEARTPEYYKKCPCAELVYMCAKLLEEYLEKQGI